MPHRALPVEATRRLLRREAYPNLVRLLGQAARQRVRRHPP